VNRLLQRAVIDVTMREVCCVKHLRLLPLPQIQDKVEATTE